LVQLLARERLQEPLEVQQVRRAQQELQGLQGRRALQALPPEARVVRPRGQLVVRVVRPRGQLVVRQVRELGEQVGPLVLALLAQEQGLPLVRALPQEQLRHCHRQCGRERLLPRRSRLRRRGFLR
jgi:hypothetical protein